MSHEESESPEQRFARLVRWAREQRGWSQDELARQLKAAGLPLHQTGLARLEAGDRGIRLNEAAVISKVIGLGLDAFGGAQGGISAITSDEEAEEISELIDRMQVQKLATQEELKQLHQDYEEQVTKLRVSVQNLEIGILHRAQVLKEYNQRRRKELGGQ